MRKGTVHTVPFDFESSNSSRELLLGHPLGTSPRPQVYPTYPPWHVYTPRRLCVHARQLQRIISHYITPDDCHSSMRKKKNTAVRCDLRRHRRAWGLTQREIASLVGLRSTAHVSRIEHGKRPPSLEAALACQVIFGIPPDALFPHVYHFVEEKTMRNVYKEHRRLENTTKPVEIRKRELYALALSRAITRSGNSHAS